MQSTRKRRPIENGRDNSRRDGDSAASSVWSKNRNDLPGFCPQPTLLREASG